jgi:hypothetical protein
VCGWQAGSAPRSCADLFLVASSGQGAWHSRTTELRRSAQPGRGDTARIVVGVTATELVKKPVRIAVCASRVELPNGGRL